MRSLSCISVVQIVCFSIPSVGNFFSAPTCFQRAVLIVAEATKHSGLGIQCNIQLQCVSSSAGEAEGIQPLQHFRFASPSWAPGLRWNNSTQQLHLVVHVRCFPAPPAGAAAARRIWRLWFASWLPFGINPTGGKHLFDWFTPLTPSQDVCTALMITAYASLSWKDTLSCQRTTTQLCWPLLKQVRTGGRYGYILAELGEETECSESEKRGCFTAGYLLP